MEDHSAGLEEKGRGMKGAVVVVLGEGVWSWARDVVASVARARKVYFMFVVIFLMRDVVDTVSVASVVYRGS
jgi:chromate transport protein ChrA